MNYLDGTQRKLFAVLMRSDVALSGRALGRMTGLSQSTAQRGLVQLRDRGLVLSENAPPSLLYRLNRDHLALPALTELLNLREQLRERAAAHLAKWALPAAAAVLYGSVARDEAMAGSDVDLLLVRPPRLRPDEPEWEPQVADLSVWLTRWTGRPASIIEMTAAEIRQGLSAGEPYLVAAAAEGVLLIGRPLSAFGGRTG
jgi:predicted nucleotidyltransferase